MSQADCTHTCNSTCPLLLDVPSYKAMEPRRGRVGTLSGEGGMVGGCIVVHLQNKQGYILSRAPSNFLLIVVNARSGIQNSTREKQMIERKIQTKASLGLCNFGSNQAITFNKHQSTVMVKSFDGLHTALCWLVCICQSPSAVVFPFFFFFLFLTYIYVE